VLASAEKVAYVTDSLNHRIRRIDLTSSSFPVTTLAGAGSAGYLNGVGTSTLFNGPTSIAISPIGGGGKYMYVADSLSYRIRLIDLTTNPVTVSLFAGTGNYMDAYSNNVLAVQANLNGVAGLLEIRNMFLLC
jgi:hypothetical protein